MMRVFAGRGPAVIRWVFGAGSGFCVGRTVGGFNYCFSWVFCWCWRGVPFGGEGGGRWAIILWGLGIFLIFRNFLRF